jgi:hypothetical protein
MVLISGLERLLGRERLPLYGHFGGIEMTKNSMLNFFSLAGNLQMYQYATFVVTSSSDRESRPIYRNLYMIEGYNEEYFFPT